MAVRSICGAGVAAVFASDDGPTGWISAGLGQVRPGDVVAVWGCGGVWQVAARTAALLGAERVIAIEHIPERLTQAEHHMGGETIDYTTTDVGADLRERSGGRDPDVCIEAVGMQAHTPGPEYPYDQVKQQLGLQSDPPTPSGRRSAHAARAVPCSPSGYSGGATSSRSAR